MEGQWFINDYTIMPGNVTCFIPPKRRNGAGEGTQTLDLCHGKAAL